MAVNYDLLLKLATDNNLLERLGVEVEVFPGAHYEGAQYTRTRLVDDGMSAHGARMTRECCALLGGVARIIGRHEGQVGALNGRR